MALPEVDVPGEETNTPPDVQSRMQKLNNRQFGAALPGRFANGSAFGTNHPADIALGKARLFKTHARAAARQKAIPIWEPMSVSMGRPTQGGV